MELKVGDKLRFDYGDGNINNHVAHVRAIVDGDQVVVRVWSPRRGWGYLVVYRESLVFAQRVGVLTVERGGDTTEREAGDAEATGE